jgi:hypothetical protein
VKVKPKIVLESVFLDKPLPDSAGGGSLTKLDRDGNGSTEQNKTNRKKKHMSHGIQQPHDIVLSTEGTEWHKLAEQVATIGDMEVEKLLFPIIESPCFIEVDGQRTALPEHKVLCADHRGIRPDLKESDRIVPLHIPKSSYNVIDNRQVWDSMKKSLREIDAKITSVGTLEGGRKFFISTSIGDSEQVINRDRFKFHLNFITSHDGTVAMNTYDSSIRIVCMNTFKWSQNAAGEVGFKVYHTKNADLALDGLPDLVNSILKGRVGLKEVMEKLAETSVSKNDALKIAAGYFATTTGDAKLSTRSMNAAEEIVRLFDRGVGNYGQSLYDLANGATEYWTSGDGTGKAGATIAQRTYRSEMGAAADHKCAFIAMLSSKADLEQVMERGVEALTLAAR